MFVVVFPRNDALALLILLWNVVCGIIRMINTRFWNFTMGYKKYERRWLSIQNGSLT